MSKRILFVYQHLPHYRLGVFSELDQSRYFETTFAGGTHDQTRSIPSIEKGRLADVRPLRNVWFKGILWQQGLLSLLKQDWACVVFLGDPRYLTTWVGSLALRLKGVPVVFWTIGWHSPDGLMQGRIRRAFYRLADRLMLYGQSGYEIGLSEGYDASKMGVVGNSIPRPLDEDTDDPPLISQDDDHFVIGAVVRLSANKRLDLIIRAASILIERGVPIRVEILGEGPCRDEVTQLARDLQVPLTLPGAVYEVSQIAEFYRRISVSCLPENAGLSVIQSLYFGTPVVTHDDIFRQMPEFEAVVPGETGSLFRAGDVSQLADEIQIWIEKVSEHPREVAARCRKEFEAAWSPERHAERIAEFLKGVLEPASNHL